jgi:hypothetical protein
MGLNPDRAERAWVFAALSVGGLLSGLLIGYEPVGGDPDRLYRPLKTELARALGEGRLPFWSDRLGLGVPLVAESHVAAFYPPNLLLYRLLPVSTAYRWSMWAHYLALVFASYAYSRRLGITPWGSALASVSFALCGFQAIHATHEPLYSELPYLPLALLLADLFVASGRAFWLATLALALGVQWTLGHFQIQTWTNGLVVASGLWRLVADRRPWPRAGGLVAAVLWGAAIAAVQLALSWDLARAVEHTARSLTDMAYYAFPPAHWVELALPWFFRGLIHGAEDPYFLSQRTSGYEAVFYVGTIPLILAFVGALGRRRTDGPATGFWLLIIPLSFALATMPHWWLRGYSAVLQLPGVGLFRAPARYTLLTSLGLAILAGAGLDRSVGSRRFKAGLILAIVLATAAIGHGFSIASQRGFHATPAPGGLPYGLLSGLISWAVGLTAIALWRAGKVGPWIPLLVNTTELGLLYFLCPTVWGWAVSLPAESPILTRLAAEPGVGRVGGVLDDIPLSAGFDSGSPYLGMTLAPMNRLLRSGQDRGAPHGPQINLMHRRMGVTHSVWDEPVDFGTGEPVEAISDDALDLLAARPVGKPAKRRWRLVHHPNPFPQARAITRPRTEGDARVVINQLMRIDAQDVAFFATEDRPAAAATSPARQARVVAWDGYAGVLEHDGSCDVVLTRVYDEGWRARVGDEPETPVVRVDAGLQAIHIEGSGKTRVSVRYEPRALRWSGTVSTLALTAAFGTILAQLAGSRVNSNGPRARRWIARGRRDALSS